MNVIKKLKTGSIVYGNLPRGCILCQKGKKLVLFVTGICNYKCFYCPISLERRNKDRMYVNDISVKSYKEILKEAERMDAMGTGITGGEPLLRFKKTLHIIKILKDAFGEEHHIHLYTSGLGINMEKIKMLEKAGLDELRIHIIEDTFLTKLCKIVRNITKIELGIEIPVLPDSYLRIKKWILYLDKIHIRFLNLNEMEFTEANSLKLLEKGYKLRYGSLTAVEGSRRTALRIIRFVEKNKLNINVHFCPVEVKDRYQISLRLFRRAYNIAKKFEIVSDEGTIIRAMLIDKNEKIRKKVKKIFPSTLIKYVGEKYIFTSPYLALRFNKFLKKNGIDIKYIEYLPTNSKKVIKNIF